MNAPATTIERAAKERPILFSGPMIRAILDGRKTQTRRIVKPQPLPELREQDGFWFADGLYVWKRRITYNVSITSQARCPFGVPGDRLWCRETWAPADQMYQGHDLDEPGVVAYRADLSARFQDPGRYAEPGPVPAYDLASWNFDALRWRPSIHMPRWASRISLEVTGVRVERLQAISEADAQAEGVDGSKRYLGHGDFDEEFPSEVFAALWDSINGAGSWASNPWVWCVSFRRVEGR